MALTREWVSDFLSSFSNDHTVEGAKIRELCRHWLATQPSATVTDNSPKYFENLKMWIDSVAETLLPRGTENGFIKVQEALRAAAAQARENAELRAGNALISNGENGPQNISFNQLQGRYVSLLRELSESELVAESAESANHALRDEVERLRGALTKVVLAPKDRKARIASDALTGTEQENPHGLR